jgi:hypothetical protein
LRPFNILRAVSTVERLETERGIISNGVKEVFPWKKDKGDFILSPCSDWVKCP